MIGKQPEDDFMSLNPALQIIKHYEGLKLAPYICAGGKNTIGYGHVIKSYENFKTITESDADRLLIGDVSFADQAVKKLVQVKLNTNQHCALVSFVFNLGARNFEESTLLKIVNAGNHLDVPEQLIRWTRAGGNKLRGLCLRRLSEAMLYLR